MTAVNTRVFVLGGATACGKSGVVQYLAERQGASILSADAMLVYKGMDIGTAKPTVAERGRVRYGGIDLATPAERFTAGLWTREARRFLTSTEGPVFVTGGSGLYIKSLTDGFDADEPSPAVREKYRLVFEEEGMDGLRRRLPSEVLSTLADPENPRRLQRALELLETGTVPSRPAVNPPAVFPVLFRSRAVLHKRIEERVHEMFEMGFEREVEELQRIYPVWSETADKAIGYSEVRAFLAGELTRAEMIERTIIRTRQLAKRQDTWFAHQAGCIRIEAGENESVESLAKRVLKIWEECGETRIRI